MTTTSPTSSTEIGNQTVMNQNDGGTDFKAIRAEFPALRRTVNGHPLVYLDSAATTQKPQCVIDAVTDFYTNYSANVHRGVHTLSQEATAAYEGARNNVREYVNAADLREIIFTRGTTDGVNLVANSWGKANLKAGDEILLSGMEHHSDIVPWQMIARQTGAVIRVIPVTDEGELDLTAFSELLNERTRIVGCVHVSNALGTINPVKEIVRRAHAVGAVVLLDGAQALPHLRVDVRDLECDFYTTSAHKWFGPTGIGFLYGKYELLDVMDPWLGGGDMIKSVTFEETIYNDLPYKFEAGTPNIAGAIGMGTAIDFLRRVDVDAVAAYENDLLAYGTERLLGLAGVRLIGTAAKKASVLSFVMEGIHPHDIGTILDQQGIAIRTGHHCTQPLMERFGLTATARASLAVYSNREDLDALVKGLRKVIEVFN